MGCENMFESEFQQLLKLYQSSIGIRSRFLGLIKDFFPGQQMQVNLMISAYDLGIVKELDQAVEITNSFAFRFVKRLMDEYGISRKNADWAIAVWCVCYGRGLLCKPCEVKLSRSTAPAIPAEMPRKEQYGDLFSYEKDSSGAGLSVAAFRGNSATVIFQPKANGQRVISIKSGAFTESALEGAIITDGFVRIGEKAFCGSSKLRQVVLPDTLAEISGFAFAGCTGLCTLPLPGKLEQIGPYALSGTGLKSIQLPKTLMLLGEGAFSQCSALEQIVIPESIQSISGSLFHGCTSLKKIRLHEKLLEIGDYSFSECTSLLGISIPDSVQRIGEHAFDGTNENFVITCSMGSCAESFARSRKIKYQLV